MNQKNETTLVHILQWNNNNLPPITMSALLKLKNRLFGEELVEFSDDEEKKMHFFLTLRVLYSPIEEIIDFLKMYHEYKRQQANGSLRTDTGFDLAKKITERGKEISRRALNVCKNLEDMQRTYLDELLALDQKISDGGRKGFLEG